MTQTTVDRVAIIRRLHDCLNRGDMDTIRQAILAPDIVWIISGRNPIGRPLHGADEVITYFQQINSVGVQADLIGLDEFGQDTVIELHHAYTQRPVNGAMLDGNACVQYQIVNGKIQHVQAYLSDAYNSDNFFWAACKLKPIPDRLA